MLGCLLGQSGAGARFPTRGGPCVIISIIIVIIIISIIVYNNILYHTILYYTNMYIHICIIYIHTYTEYGRACSEARPRTWRRRNRRSTTCDVV